MGFNIQHGDVLLVHSKLNMWNPMAWLTALIRLFTGSKWNHASVIILTKDEFRVYEAKSGGVVISSLDAELKGYVKLLRPNFDVNGTSLSLLADNYIEKSKYDYWNLLLWQPIYRITGFWLGADTPNKVLCSEFVIRVLVRSSADRVSLVKKHNINFDSFSPSDLDKCTAFTHIYEGTI